MRYRIFSQMMNYPDAGEKWCAAPNTAKLNNTAWVPYTRAHQRTKKRINKNSSDSIFIRMRIYFHTSVPLPPLFLWLSQSSFAVFSFLLLFPILHVFYAWCFTLMFLFFAFQISAHSYTYNYYDDRRGSRTRVKYVLSFNWLSVNCMYLK